MQNMILAYSSKCYSVTGVFYGRDEPYFVCTHSASASDRHRYQTYLPGTGDTVMTWAVPPEGCLSIALKLG